MSLENLTIEQINAMNDEDFAKLDPNALAQEDIARSGNDDTANNDLPNGQENNDDPDEQDDDDEDENNNNNDDPNPDDEDEDNPNPDNQDDEEEQEDDPNADPEKLPENPADKPVKEKPVKKETETKQEEADIDYAAFHAEMTKPFKANGKEFQIKSTAEAISLMQKGLNYNHKMNQIKPYQEAGRLLEEHGLLGNTEQLSFMIDLLNKKPEAIAKLVKDSGLEAYELDEEKASAYQPTPVNMTPENVYQLRETVANNKGNADFDAVYSDVNAWDQNSQQAIINNPQILETLTRHKQDGIYDQVMRQVEHEINVRDNKTPVMDLYVNIGKQMFPTNDNAAQANVKNKGIPAPSEKVTKRVDPRLEQKRKAAGGTKSSKSKSTTVALTEEDIFAMDDNAFNAIDISKLHQ